MWSSSEVSGCLAAKNTQLCEQTLAVILATRLSEQQNSKILAFAKDFETNTLKAFLFIMILLIFYIWNSELLWFNMYWWFFLQSFFLFFFILL